MVTRSYDELAQALLGEAEVVVCGHVNPDGDCLGSVLALAHALRATGARVTPLVAQRDASWKAFSFLPGSDDIRTPEEYRSQTEGVPDLFVSVDVPSLERLGDAAALQTAAHATVAIDHHPDTVDFAGTVYSDSTASAAGIIIWELSAALGVEPFPDLATCCYVATMTDTGRFQYQNTDARTFSSVAAMVSAGARPDLAAREVYQNRSFASLRLEEMAISHLELRDEGRLAISWVAATEMARMGSTKADADGLSDVLRSLSGVQVAVLLRIQEDGSIRGSLRAKGDQDVSAIARVFGGGGHVAAAGFTYQGAKDELIARLVDMLGAD